jgi:hypothetical protein
MRVTLAMLNFGLIRAGANECHASNFVSSHFVHLISFQISSRSCTTHITDSTSMEDSWMDIGYVVVDDFEFTPIGVSARAKMKPTQDVLNMIRQVRADNPELLKYGMVYFQVVKILQPVLRETITPGQDSETLKAERTRLAPIDPGTVPRAI